MWAFLCYLLVLLAYLPGLWVVVRSKAAGRLPLITFCFLGLFLFNAAGEILIVGRFVPSEINPTSKLVTVPLISPGYTKMLILQAILFYSVAGPYFWYRARRMDGNALVGSVSNLADRVFPLVVAVLILAIVSAYFVTGGRAILFDLLSGNITAENILEFRSATYGRLDFWFYRLGFFVLPAILAAFIVLRSSAQGRFTLRDGMWIGCCLLIPLLLAEKSGVLYIAGMLIIAYGMHLASRHLSLAKLLSLRVASLLMIAFVPTVAAYGLYYRTTANSLPAMTYKLAFRIVGVYTESLAATVPFVETFGELRGRTLPTIHGLIPHERLNLEAAMHAFLWHGSLAGIDVSLPGSVSVSAGGEGYVNFGWVGFIVFSVASFACVVLLQELLLRLRIGLIGGAMSVWYAWLSMMLATTGLFATLASLVHTGLFVMAVVFCWALSVCENVRQKRCRNTVLPKRNGVAA